MEKKKLPYQPPQVTRIVLKQEQAILSQCSYSRSSASTTGSKCIAAGCRQARTGTQDNSIVS